MKKLFIFAAFLVTIFSLQIFSQIVERKKPEVKDFGSSLGRNSEENLAQKKKKPATQNDDTIRIETNLVVVDFLVLDKKGNTIYGLKKEDFTVTEDNKSQEIHTFTLGDDKNIPRSIVLIIDYSGSQLPFIERSVEAAKLLVDKLRANDLMAIVTDDVELIAQFTSDKALLKEKLEQLKQNALARKVGKSQQFSALYATLNEMFDEDDVRPIVLFQTDGDQFYGLKGGFNEIVGLPPFAPAPITNFSFNNLLSTIEKSRATIYTIVPGFRLLGLSPRERSEKLRADREMRMKMSPPPSTAPPVQRSPEQMAEFKKYSEKRRDLMQKYYPNGLPDIQEIMFGMSKYSGGWIDFLEKPEDAEGVYSHILSEINTRYVIGYLPTNEVKDGKRRVIKVSVKNHNDYTVWGRKTYIAPLPD